MPNGQDGTIGGKSVPECSLIDPKKHVFGWNFLMKPAPYLFSGPNRLYGAFEGKIVPDENLAQFCLKSPLEFVFPKNTFSVRIFGLNRTSHIFMAKRTRWDDWGKKCPRVKFCPSQKTSFQSGFFDETGPIPLFWAYLATWCVRGRNCSDENIAQFCLKSPLEFVFPINTFSV